MLNVSRKTIEELGFSRVLDHLAEHARSEPGRAACRALPFLPDDHAVRRELTLVSEMKRVLGESEAPSFEELRDLSPATRYLRMGGVLAEEDLLAMGRCLDCMARLRRTLENRSSLAPTLAQLAGRIAPFDSVARRVLDSFDETGRLRDDASHRLFDARQRVKSIRNGIRRLLDDYLLDPNVGPCLQGDYFTLRENRYVLPVRISLQGRVPGIIHGTSNTDQTVYIEPELIVRQNNTLMLALEETRAAELEVLRDLSLDLRDTSDGVDDSVPRAVHLETLAARARLSLEWDCREPTLEERVEIDLANARNPLLLLQKEPVVPNTFRLSGEVRFLVISGPNAGGKSVSLNTLGLCLAFAAAGMHVPAAADSRLFLPSSLHTILGETADIQHSLSTFSGQLARLKAVLREVGERGVLLVDEIVAGTEPNEGASLAWAVLERCADQGLSGAVSTHYELLKTLPYQDPRFVNASMGLDPSTRKPTFHLTLGTPGSSSALRIAEELGFDREIVKRAGEILGTKDVRITEIIRRMEAETARTVDERRQAEAERVQMEARRADLERRLERVGRDARRLALEQKEKFLERLKAQEEELRRIVREVRQANTPETVRKVKLDLEKLKGDAAREVEAEKRELDGGPRLVPVPEARIVPGARVIHAGTGKEAEVVTVDRQRRSVFLRVGALGMKAGFGDLVERKGVQAVPDKSPGLRRPTGQPSDPGEGQEAAPFRCNENTVNLIGLRVDEALGMLEKRLDDASLADTPYLYILHGMGTGALRDGVRKFLKSSEYVASFRAGIDDEGGQAVTFVKMK
jgi:DNA mismatch repair protein MutS2